MWFLHFLSLALADPLPEKSAFEQALEQNSQVPTNERWIEINGVRYREITYQGRLFYLNFKGRDEEYAELDCSLSKPNHTHLAEIGVQAFKRSRLFIQMLQETCTIQNGQKKVQLYIDPRLGFTLPETNKSLIKNKKIYTSPSTPLGFSGEW